MSFWFYPVYVERLRGWVFAFCEDVTDDNDENDSKTRGRHREKNNRNGTNRVTVDLSIQVEGDAGEDSDVGEDTSEETAAYYSSLANSPMTPIDAWDDESDHYADDWEDQFYKGQNRTKGKGGSSTKLRKDKAPESLPSKQNRFISARAYAKEQEKKEMLMEQFLLQKTNARMKLALKLSSSGGSSHQYYCTKRKAPVQCVPGVTHRRNEISECGLPVSVVNDLMNRELTANDYELLLFLHEKENKLETVSHSKITQVPTVLCSPTFVHLGDLCVICMSEFGVGEELKQLSCDHLFHSECVCEWLEKASAKCPLCQHPVS